VRRAIGDGSAQPGQHRAEIRKRILLADGVAKHRLEAGEFTRFHVRSRLSPELDAFVEHLGPAAWQHTDHLVRPRPNLAEVDPADFVQSRRTEVEFAEGESLFGDHEGAAFLQLGLHLALAYIGVAAHDRCELDEARDVRTSSRGERRQRGAGAQAAHDERINAGGGDQPVSRAVDAFLPSLPMTALGLNISLLA